MTPPRLTAVRRAQRPITLARPRATAVVAKAKGADDEATERAIADAVQAALAKVSSSPAIESVAMSEFRRAGAGGLADVLDMAGLAQDLTDALRNPLAGVYLAKAFNSMVDLDDATAVLNLADLEPRAIAFATAQAGKRVVQITEDIRQNVAAVVTLGQEGKLTVPKMRSRIRDFIPMLPRHAAAAQKTYETQYARLMKDGKTAEEADKGAQQAFDAAATRYKRVRAEMIARTETITASNTGRFEGWAADIADGVYSTSSRKEWVAGHKPCDVCDPSTGEVVMWDQPFENGAMMPPLHPNCRCTAVLLPPDTPLRGPSAPTAPQRRADQRAEGKTPDGPTVPHKPHKDPVSDPDKRPTAGDITNEQGKDIADSAMSAVSGKITQAEHRRNVRTITGTNTEGQKVRPAGQVNPKTYREADWKDMPHPTRMGKPVRDAVDYYVTDEGYTKLNAHLRTGAPLDEAATEHLSQLRQAMDQAVTKRDLIVKRGQRTLQEFGAFSKPEDLIGRTAVSDAFLSTAGDTVGGRYMPEMKVFREAPYRFEMYVPKGTHALSANTDDEVELILAPGSQLTVIAARKDGAQTVLQVVVTQEAKP